MDTDSIHPSDLNKPISNNCSITLDPLQYISYCSRKIDIFSPDGIRLESIGYGIKRDGVESNSYLIKEQIYVLECLLSNLNSRLELPAQTVTALADLLYRMQGFCREYIK